MTTVVIRNCALVETTTLYGQTKQLQQKPCLTMSLCFTSQWNFKEVSCS